MCSDPLTKRKRQSRPQEESSCAGSSFLLFMTDTGICGGASRQVHLNSEAEVIAYNVWF